MDDARLNDRIGNTAVIASGKPFRPSTTASRDRTSEFAITQLFDKADRRTAWKFLEHLLKAVPYRIHTILTDTDRDGLIRGINAKRGIQFAEQPRNRNTAWSRQMRFDLCKASET